MRITIVFIILIVGLNGTCWSQGSSNTIEPVVFPGVKKWGHPTSIQFYDTISGKLTKTVDFSAENPYKLPYKLVDTSRDTTGWQFEITEGASIDTNYLFSSEYTICRNSDRLPKYIDVTVKLADQQGDFVVLAYQMVTMDRYQAAIGGRTTVYIMDTKGNLLQEFKDLPHDFSSMAINSTGEYLMVCFAGPYNCSDYKYKRQGARIFETSSKNEVYRSTVFDGNGVAQVDNGLFEIRNTIENRGERYMFFDPANRKIYVQEFSDQEQMCLKSVTRSDFRIQCGGSSTERRLNFTSLPSKGF
ncbi:MAG: hypothetical protein ABIO24_12710 [Saprospiraceae bacterium]